MPWRYATAVWTAGALLLVYSLVIAWTGGFDLTFAGIRFRSRTWQRPALIGFLTIAIVARVDRRRARYVTATLAARAWRRWSAAVTVVRASSVAGVAALWTIVAAFTFGAFIAGGADSSGYLNQARLFANGRALESSRIPERLPTSEPLVILSPLGFRPAPDGVKLAPTYPPGYPLLMVPGFLIDLRLAYLIVPLCGALVVWLTYALGRELGLPAAGAVAALLVSVSPPFLYQLVQPMSDVPAAAGWLLALYLARKGTRSTAVLSGLVAGAAILIRPNLLPLVAFTWAGCAVSGSAGGVRRAGAAAAATMPAVAVLGVIQAIRYGSPAASGYGQFQNLFGWENLWPNLERYPRWMFETHTPLIALFLIAPLWTARHRGPRTFLLLLWVFAGAVVAAYLPYEYFQMFEWTYTRFLLPAIPIMWLLGAAPIDSLANRISPATRALIAGPLVLLVAGFCLYVAKSRFVFEVRQGEQKYVRAAAYVRETLPPNAVLICMQHSGSLWFYTSRPIVRWDYLNPREVDELLAWFASHGYQPFVVVDGEEFTRIRARFLPRARHAIERLRPLGHFGDATIYAFE